MKIVNLIENTPGSVSDCKFEHGLSFYIETAGHRLLVDTGASDAFLENAGRMGVDLSKVDTLIVSHGHYDHTGGLLGFAKKNPNARIFMRKTAGRPYYHINDRMEKYIGIDPRIMELPNLILTDRDCRLDQELYLFGNVTGRNLWPSGNRELKLKSGEAFYQDEFDHEQYLVIHEKRRVLISGCAHNGILNILERYRQIFHQVPDAVISGFHMQKKSGYTPEDISTIQQIGRELSKMETVFYTGHCTGEIPYRLLKEQMGERLTYIHSTDTWFI